MTSALLSNGNRASVAMTPLRSLDLPLLIRNLSEPVNLPESFHIRNRLLHAFLLDPSFSPSPVRSSNRRRGNGSAGSLLRNAWETVWERNGILEGWAVGDVPAGLIKYGSSTGEARSAVDSAIEDSRRTHPDKKTRSPWGILLLSQARKADRSIMSTGGAPPPEPVVDPHRRPETLRLDLWLDQSCTPGSPTANLAISILETLVPRLLQKHSAPPLDEKQKGTKEEEDVSLKVLFCSFEETLADLVHGRADDAPDRVKITFDNPCIRYIGSSDSQPRFVTQQGEDESEQKGGLWYSLSAPWRLGSLSKEEPEIIEEVMRTNKIPFPRQYVESHVHISTAVFCDDDDDNEAESKKPVGWAYFHSDLAIASLFVKPDFRRRKVEARLVSTDEINEGCVQTSSSSSSSRWSSWANISHKLAEAQTAILDALRLGEMICACVGDDVERAEGYRSNPKYGYGIGPCDVVGETEVGNAGARRFMEEGAGFRAGGKTSWMQVELVIPQDE
ncbi:hypothetical protein OC861_001360 [Tilletia horrida]|nr:hypothetical protein OC861_001360 [Tilletia horrida]